MHTFAQIVRDLEHIRDYHRECDIVKVELCE